MWLWIRNYHLDGVVAVCVTTIVLLLGCPTWVRAQPSEQPTQPRLAVVPKSGSGPAASSARYRFKMGDTLRISASGDYAAKITEALKASGPSAVTLYLNDVAMTTLAMTPVQLAPESGLRLEFYLARDSQDDGSRAQWGRLLRKQRGFLMTLPIALAIGVDPPLLVHTQQPLQFYVAPEVAIWWTLAGGLAIFLVVYSLLVRSRSVLRDQ